MLTVFVLLGAGALVGLIPYALGRYMNKPELGKLGLVCCTLSGALLLEAFTAIGFVIALLVKKDDYHRRGSSPPPAPAPAPGFDRPTTPVNTGSLGVACISGPLRGRTYRVDRGRTLIGLNPECQIRFPEGTPGVSHRHCSVNWDAQSSLVLTDLGSSYGTFLGDGRQLPPNFPMSLQPGSRFYLATTACMFQVVLC